MKICYVANGASIHTQRWVNYFAKKGHEMHLICWKVMPGYGDTVKIHLLTRLAPKLWAVSQYASFLLWVHQVRRLIRQIKPDIVDGHFVTLYGFLAACSGFHPLIVTAWGSDLLIYPRRNPLFKVAARYALNKADVIVCLFPVDVVKEHIAELGIDSSKIRTALLGVDAGEFSPMCRDEKIRQALGIEDSQPVVISTRALAPIYDVETLVRAIPIVLAEIPRAAFVVVGTGQLQGYLQKLARGLGVSNSTRFVGWVPRTQLPKYLALADVYVSTSLSDGASNSLLEAMACGLAPVVTDIPANRAWVADGENGFLFPVRDYRALASKIIHVLDNTETRRNFGKRSRRIVQERAEEETEMKRLYEIYHEIAEAGSILAR